MFWVLNTHVSTVECRVQSSVLLKCQPYFPIGVFDTWGRVGPFSSVFFFYSIIESGARCKTDFFNRTNIPIARLPEIRESRVVVLVIRIRYTPGVDLCCISTPCDSTHTSEFVVCFRLGILVLLLWKSEIIRNSKYTSFWIWSVVLNSSGYVQKNIQNTCTSTYYELVGDYV